jgi:hypothetical protein
LAQCDYQIAAKQGTAAPVSGHSNLWIDEYSGSKIARLTPAGQYTEFPISSSGRPTHFQFSQAQKLTMFAGRWHSLASDGSQD